MTAAIVNGAPMTIMLGTQDKSTRRVAAEAEALPTHLPLIYIYAKKGPTTPQLVVGSSRTQMYGDDSFDLRKPYATHATVLCNAINKAGNGQMLQRVKPADAGPNASLRLSLDLLPTNVDNYSRNSDGSIKTDVGGNPIVLGQIPGFKAKWVVTPVPTDVATGALKFGIGTQGAGDQTDGATQSVRYPIADIMTPDFGADGNNRGIRIWAPTQKSAQPVDERVIQNEKVYPFRIACAARADAISTSRVVETLAGEQSVQVSWKEGVLNRLTDSLLSIDDVFIQAYQTLNDPTFPDVYGPFGKLHVYHDQLETVLALVYAKEKDFIDAFSDFTGEAGEEHRFNLIGGCSSAGVQYHTFQLITGTANSARLADTTTLYAAGGSDGTMDEESFAQLVAAEVAEFANETSVLQDTAKYPVSVIYDSGFPLATKYALLNFLAVRKDTAVVLSTHDVLGAPLSASEESALAIALKTRAQMFPESEYFGTPVMRCMIVGRSGKMIGTQYRKHLPLTLEIAAKAATYMGAGNGRWKSGYAFDSAPLSEVSMFQDINVTFTPAKVRNKDWANGLNWVESFGRRSVYFPALKTVYEDDTSVLNSFFTMMACVELQKVGDRARRQYSGNSQLTNAQLIERVNKFVQDDVEGRFDGRFVIQPDAYFTDTDLQRGYSWTLPIKLYAANMKTVMTLSIEAYRIEDLASA